MLASIDDSVANVATAPASSRGKLSGQARRMKSNAQRLAKKQNVKMYAPDLSLAEFAAARLAMKPHRSGTARPRGYGDNPILQVGWFENVDSAADTVSKNLRSSAALLTGPHYRHRAILLAFGVRWTQSGRGSSKVLANALAKGECAFRKAVQVAPCGSGPVATAVLRSADASQSVEACANVIADTAYAVVGRICFFHSCMTAIDLGRLGVLDYASDAMPLLTGSEKGFSFLRAFEGSTARSVEVVRSAHVPSLTPTEVQTLLCMYSKYVKYRSVGVGRAYRLPKQLKWVCKGNRK